MKNLPFTREQLESIASRWPTPFHIYDEAAIVANARRLKAAFAWNAGFHEYFAVKAAPNPHLMALLRAEGFGSDCSSMAELVLAEAVGNVGEDIMFTSNDTPAEEFQKAAALGAIINLDDITHLDFLEKSLDGRLPDLLCCRWNPGPLKGGNAIIGKPEEAKYGFTKPQLLEAYRRMKEKGVKRFGLHTMVASNERRTEAFLFTAKLMFGLARELQERLGIHVEFLDLGGGFGIPYRPEEEPLDLEAIGEGIHKLYDEMMVPAGLGDVAIFTECGRLITGPSGWLVSTVIHEKKTYKDYIGLDSCMANLMRPAMYGAYHHITIAGKENAPCDHKYDITGSLCENNDKFAIDRMLPEIEIGDLLIIHDTGAHGSAMGFNYNGKLWCAELLLREDGSIELIRRAETLADHFATLTGFDGAMMK